MYFELYFNCFFEFLIVLRKIKVLFGIFRSIVPKNNIDFGNWLAIGSTVKMITMASQDWIFFKNLPDVTRKPWKLVRFREPFITFLMWCKIRIVCKSQKLFPFCKSIDQKKFKICLFLSKVKAAKELT